MTGAGLRGRLLAIMDAHGRGGAVDPVQVEELAVEVLRYQATHGRVYGALCRRRGIDPARVDRWEAFPPVPVRAFQAFDVEAVEDGAGAPEAIFRTSGTTGGPRGVHRVHDLELYHRSLLAHARRSLVPLPGRVVALLPSPRARPDSSLVHMVGQFARYGGAGGEEGFHASPEWVLDTAGFEAALEEAQVAGEPVLVAGTAFAFVHWLDGRPAGARHHVLPAGSRVVETGGFKGRSREVEPAELHSLLSAALGVPGGAIVNEYGMTEMLSQFWEPPDARVHPPGERWHEGPPWVRTRILDPDTLEPAEAGAPGVLCHLDLANLHSASLLLTEDVGVPAGPPGRGGFRVPGRVQGAPPRGCSLAMEEVLAAERAGERPGEGHREHPGAYP
ncbi:MAG: acyl-protein synthetase [Gemmatimonadales bacterium]|nr:MAG: acyl-protein synthetase [Gemmatimonadales bacterium]